MCLGLKSVDDKSNEIPAVITADAMHCQRETAKAIIDKKADYLLMAKGNQPALSEALNQTLLKAMESDDGQTRRISKTRKSRNREETR
jgi:predicted transposase YbfD/YdcC